MNLSISDLVSAAEIISSFAIIVSLFYVGKQISLNTRANKSESANSAIALMHNWYQSTGSSSQASSLWYKANSKGISELEPEEVTQYMLLAHSIMLAMQNSFALLKEGTLDAGIHEALSSTILLTKNSKAFGAYWEQRKSHFTCEFQAYVDKIRSSEIAPNPSLIYPGDENSV